MQSEEVGFQSAFERGQRLGCSDVHNPSTIRSDQEWSLWKVSS